MVEPPEHDAVLDQTVRDSLGRWYVDALGSSGIAPVGDPKLDLDELPAQGQSLRFSIEIGVLPSARLGDYRGVELAEAAQVGRWGGRAVVLPYLDGRSTTAIIEEAAHRAG